MDYSEIRLRIQTLLANPSTPEARTLRTDVEEAWEHYMLFRMISMNRCVYLVAKLYFEIFGLLFKAPR